MNLLPEWASLVESARSEGGREATDLPALLIRQGWVLSEPDARRGRDKWTKDGLTAVHHRQSSPAFVLTLLEMYDPSDADDFDVLYANFERGYDSVVESIAALVGPPDVRSTYGEPKVPVPGEFDRAALWFGPSLGIIAAFQHEDRDVPLRLSIGLFEVDGDGVA